MANPLDNHHPEWDPNYFLRPTRAPRSTSSDEESELSEDSLSWSSYEPVLDAPHSPRYVSLLDREEEERTAADRRRNGVEDVIAWLMDTDLGTCSINEPPYAP